jgi:hypothetical protein
MRYAKQERIGDQSLCDAIERAERGLVDADFENAIIEGILTEVSYDNKK